MTVSCEKCNAVLELPEYTDQWDDFPMTKLTCECGHINEFQWYGYEILQHLNHTLHRNPKVNGDE